MSIDNKLYQDDHQQNENNLSNLDLLSQTANSNKDQLDLNILVNADDKQAYQQAFNEQQQQSQQSSDSHNHSTNNDQHTSTNNTFEINPQVSHQHLVEFAQRVNEAVDQQSNSMNDYDDDDKKNKNKRKLGNNNNKSNSLLSEAERKANHIRSEKKRRNQIRLGYEALTESVPALREGPKEGDPESKRRRGRIALSGNPNGIELSNERSHNDGKGGPKSEAVILQKSVDYLRELFNKRDNLLNRLQVIQSGHPMPNLVSPPSPSSLVESVGHDGLRNPKDIVPIWYAKWDGQNPKGVDLDDDLKI